MTAACPACEVAPAAVNTARMAVPNITLSVPGMQCAACIGKVERLLSALPGVQSPRVNLTLKRVAVHSDLPADRLIQHLATNGYEAFPLDQAILGKQDDPQGRDLALRLGVAGFAMMNVMLLSVAVWSGAQDATRDLFHLISASIAVPVVAFSGQPFFKNAWRALNARSLNMDVPISLAILLATGMSVYESLNGGEHAYFDAGLSLTFFLLIGRFLDHRTRVSAGSAARELAALEVQTAQKIDRQGHNVTVPLTEISVNDRVLVPTGTRVPVDGALHSKDAVTDRSFLTGESDPVTTYSKGMIRAGEINLGAPFTLTATAVGEDTSLRRVARLVEQAENARNRYTSLADKAARVYAPAVHLLALAAFLGWIALSGDIRFALNVAIAVLIITCPCALGLAVPAVSTAAIGKLYELGFLVKSGTALERLAEIDTVVFDKTGTLTQPGTTLALDQLSDRNKSIALALAQCSTHPVSRVIAQALADISPAVLSDVSEAPGIGLTGFQNGTVVFLGRGDDGLILNVGDRTFPLGHSETLRPGSRSAVGALAGQNMTISLMSGDKPSAVAHAAKELGISETTSQASPEDKHRLIKSQTQAGHRITMIGDGLNDTAALAAAHASVAPSSALDASRNAADVVLLRNSLEDLPRLFKIARLASRLSRQNFAIAAFYNLIAVPIALAGFATPLIAALAMSVSSLTVLINALRVRLA